MTLDEWFGHANLHDMGLHRQSTDGHIAEVAATEWNGIQGAYGPNPTWVTENEVVGYLRIWVTRESQGKIFSWNGIAP